MSQGVEIRNLSSEGRERERGNECEEVRMNARVKVRGVGVEVRNGMEVRKSDMNGTGGNGGKQR